MWVFFFFGLLSENNASIASVFFLLAFCPISTLKSENIFKSLTSLKKKRKKIKIELEPIGLLNGQIHLLSIKMLPAYNSVTGKISHAPGPMGGGGGIPEIREGS